VYVVLPRKRIEHELFVYTGEKSVIVSASYLGGFAVGVVPYGCRRLRPGFAHDGLMDLFPEPVPLRVERDIVSLCCRSLPAANSGWQCPNPR